MDHTTMVFIGLLVILFLGQVFMNESFVDASGADASGADASGNITLTLSDLMALLGSGSSSSSKGKDEENDDDDDTDSNRDKYYRNMRADMMNDVKHAVKEELIHGKFSALYGSSSSSSSTGSDTCDGSVMEDSCIDSFSSQQGSDFMKYIPGKNPDDYIRKDSVPCYGCSIP